MVEFFDPVTNTTLSYYIDKNLVKKWDKLRDGRLVKKDQDRVYIVDGRERIGKSVWTLQQAKYINPNFNINNVCFTAEEFLDKIRTAQKGEVIVFDEAFQGLSSKSSLSRTNKAIVQAMMEMGQKNLVVFIVLPTIFLLELYAAILRSEVLFHIYKIKTKDGSDKRGFRVYNHRKKTILYQLGKKNGFSYSKPHTRLIGYFFNKYPIDEKAYRDKKDKSLRTLGILPKKQESLNAHKFAEQRDYLIYLLKKELKITYKDMEEVLSKGQVMLSYRTLRAICNKIQEKQGKMAQP